MDDLINLFQKKKEPRMGEVKKSDFASGLEQRPTIGKSYGEEQPIYEALKSTQRLIAEKSPNPLLASEPTESDVESAQRAMDVGTASGGIKYSKELGPKVVDIASKELEKAKEFLSRAKKIEPPIAGEKVVSIERPSQGRLTKEERIEKNIEEAIAQQNIKRVHKPEFNIFPEPYQEPSGKVLQMSGPQVDMFRELMTEMKKGSKVKGGEAIPLPKKIEPSKQWDIAAEKSQQLVKQQREGSKVALPESAYKEYGKQPVSKESLIDLFAPKYQELRKQKQIEAKTKPQLESETKVLQYEKPATRIDENNRGALDDESYDEMNKYFARFGDDQKQAEAVAKHMLSLEDNPYGFLKGKHGGFSVPNFEMIREGKVPKRLGIENATGDLMGQDPFQWTDAKYGVTKTILKRAKSLGQSMEINTGSDLIAHDDYIASLPENSKITLWISNINPEANRVIFPGSPSDKRIFQAAQKLKSAGFDVKIKSRTEDFIKKSAKKQNISEFDLQKILDPKWSRYGE